MLAVATRDIMAGELVMEEKEPLLYFSQADVELYKCASPDIDVALAGYKAFESILSPAKRRKILSLPCLTASTVSDNIRKLLQDNPQIRCGADGQSKAFTAIELKMIVKVFQVLRYLDSGPRVVSALQEAVLAYVDALENICTYPGEFLSSELTDVVTHCSKICFKPVSPPLKEKALCLKALRMHLLLYGRETRHFILDNVSAKVPHKAVPTHSLFDVYSTSCTD
eukprot:gene16963-19332_t